MKSSDLINNLQAMVDADTYLGDEARALLIDNPLSDSEAADAKRQNLSHLEYRLMSDSGMVEELFDQSLVDFAKAKAGLVEAEADITKAKVGRDKAKAAYAKAAADIVLAAPIINGREIGAEWNKNDFKKRHKIFKHEVREKMLGHMSGGKTFAQAKRELNLSVDKTFYRGTLSKKELTKEVIRRKKSLKR
jgi:hypothetical protein